MSAQIVRPQRLKLNLNIYGMYCIISLLQKMKSTGVLAAYDEIMARNRPQWSSDFTQQSLAVSLFPLDAAPFFLLPPILIR